MSLYIQPERELTAEEKLIAALVGLQQRIPSGFQIGMPLHIDRAIVRVDELFGEHKLLLHDELVGELQLWREHATQGLKFAQQCDLLMERVIRSIGPAEDIRARRQAW